MLNDLLLLWKIFYGCVQSWPQYSAQLCQGKQNWQLLYRQSWVFQLLHWSGMSIACSCVERFHVIPSSLSDSYTKRKAIPAPAHPAADADTGVSCLNVGTWYHHGDPTWPSCRAQTPSSLPAFHEFFRYPGKCKMMLDLRVGSSTSLNLHLCAIF